MSPPLSVLLPIPLSAPLSVPVPATLKVASRYDRTLLLAGAVLLLSGSFAPARAQGGAATPASTLGPPTTTLVLNSSSDVAKAAFDAGYVAFLERDWLRASAEFKRAFAADSQLKLARALEIGLRGGDPADADEIDRLRVRNGSRNIIETTLFMSLREWRLGRFGPSTALLDAASRIAANDNRLLAHYHLNLAIGSAGRVAIARALREREPDNYRWHAYVATALAPADSSEALAAMGEALRLGRDRPYPHWAAGLLLTRMRRYEEATAHFGQALRLDPDYYVAALDRARLAMYQGRYADARRDLDEVQKRAAYGPDLGLAMRGAALTWLHRGDIDRAMLEMTRAAQRFESEQGSRPESARAHGILAYMAGAKKDLPKVEHHLAEQARLGGRDGSAWGAMAWSLAGQPSRARQELTTYEKLVATGAIAPAAGEPAAVRAMVLTAEGKHSEALDAAGNTNANHFALLARYLALTGLGRKQEASDCLQRLLTLNNHVIDASTVPIARLLYGERAARN